MTINHVLVVFLFHGVDGAASDFATLEASLWTLFASSSSKLPETSTRLFTYKLNEYAGRKTYAGIEKLGSVAANELCEHLVNAVLPQLGPDVSEINSPLKDPSTDTQPRPTVLHLSLVAHSLGGLVARYAAALLLAGQSPLLPTLLSKHPHISLDPLSFLTISSPHMGARLPEGVSYLSTAYAKTIRYGAAMLYQKSGKELFLEDPDTLIAGMADPESDYCGALSLFSNRTLTGLVQGDIVPYCSALIRPTNPFADAASRPTTKEPYGFYILERSGFSEAEDSELFADGNPGVGSWTCEADPPEPPASSPDTPTTPMSPNSQMSVWSAAISSQSSSSKSTNKTTNFVSDPANSLLYLPSILASLSQLSFRRVSLHLSLPLPFSLAVHALAVGKAPLVPAFVSQVAEKSAGFHAGIVMDDFVRRVENWDER